MEIEVTSIEINRNIKIRGIVNSIAFKIKTNLNEKYLSIIETSETLKF